MHPRVLLIPIVCFTMVVSVGCGIRKDIHQAALDTITDQEGEIRSLREQLAELQELSDRLTGELEDTRGRLSDVTDDHDRLLTENNALRQRLEQMGEDVDRLTAETGELAADLDEARRALSELRKRQEAFEQAQRNLEAITARLQELIDAGTLSVRLERGRIVINMRQDILFGSGSAEVSDEGGDALADVAAALADFSDRNFQVEGHTDNVPIKTARFPSNWELSTARAVAVVQILIESGMAPEHISAAGFGEYWPVSANDTAEGRALNRRIEIVMQPDLGALFEGEE